MTNEERDLLNRMNTGAYDGVVGSIRATKFGYAVWNEIKDGIAFKEFKSSSANIIYSSSVISKSPKSAPANE